MAGICISSIRKSGPGCDHRTVTVDLDGTTVTLHTSEAELDAVGLGDRLPSAWATLTVRDLMSLLELKRRRVAGLALDDAVGRCINGDEGNNVKVYPIVAKDVTKTNVGTAYVNVPVGANGERRLVNFFGHTQFRVRIWANLVGTGAFGFRMVRDSDNEVLYENASISQTGERELDTDWQSIPSAFQNQPDGTLLRLQIKSVTAADDPVVRGCDVGVR